METGRGGIGREGKDAGQKPRAADHVDVEYYFLSGRQRSSSSSDGQRHVLLKLSARDVQVGALEVPLGPTMERPRDRPVLLVAQSARRRGNAADATVIDSWCISTKSDVRRT